MYDLTLLTINSSICWWTCALITIQFIGTSATILTRLRLTLVDLILAVSSRVTRGTLTNIESFAVDAFAVILTGVGFAVILVDLAELSTVSFSTDTLEGIHST